MGAGAPAHGRDGGPVVDEDRFLEIWNLVFMQQELSEVRAKDDFDVLRPLPSKNIDTGLGLERVAYLLQGVGNMYETDQVFPVIQRAAELSGKRYGADAEDDESVRALVPLQDLVGHADQCPGDLLFPEHGA